MGLIRKTLSVTTVGLVRGSSTKQRVAKATERNTNATARASEHGAILLHQAASAAAQAAATEHEFRYDTDLAYRKWVDDKRDAEAARAAESLLLQQHAAIARSQAKAAKSAKRLPGSLPLQPSGSQRSLFFNPPPNWPTAPSGWMPESGWQPRPEWGPPPPGWLVWVDESFAPPLAETADGSGGAPPVTGRAPLSIAGTPARAPQAGSLGKAQRPAPPPGWYEDHADKALVRWWDGATWTEHTNAKSSGSA